MKIDPERAGRVRKRLMKKTCIHTMVLTMGAVGHTSEMAEVEIVKRKTKKTIRGGF